MGAPRATATGTVAYPPMTGRQLRNALKKLELTQQQAAAWLRCEPSTVYRWLFDARAIPGPVEAAVELALELRRRDARFPLPIPK